MNIERLYAILNYRRPHNSPTERKFYERFILPYEPVVFMDRHETALAYGIHVWGSDTPVKVLFSSHVDTVHHDDGKQKPVHDVGLDIIYKNDGKPLGADDGAGVWLMLEMIDAGVPGWYLFHRGEERGGIGSSGMAQYHEDFLKQFDHAIAFDRKGTCSIITHQGYGRCCSDAFAKDMAERLSACGYELAPDDTGVFTDTANYTDIIPECTNVSIGYYAEHTKDEMLDLAYLKALREVAILPATWTGMPVEREAGEVDYDYGWEYAFRARAEARNDPVITLEDATAELTGVSQTWVDVFVEELFYTLDEGGHMDLYKELSVQDAYDFILDLGERDASAWLFAVQSSTVDPDDMRAMVADAWVALEWLATYNGEALQQ